MEFYYYNRGSCVAVFESAENNYLYKIPLIRKYDSYKKQNCNYLKAINRYLRDEYKYYKNTFKFLENFKLLKTLKKKSNHNLEEFFPELELLNFHNEVYKISNKKYTYTGKVIKQKKVEEFFRNITSLDSFNWEEIYKIQIEMWRYGIGLNSEKDTWGPGSWGRTDTGEIKLVDTSQLTKNYKLVSKCLKPEVIRNRKRILLSFDQIHNKKILDEYFKYLSSNLNSKTLNKNWNKYN